MLNVVFVLASLHLKKRIQSFYCERTTEAGSNRTDDAAEPGDTFPPMGEEQSGKTQHKLSSALFPVTAVIKTERRQQ